MITRKNIITRRPQVVLHNRADACNTARHFTIHSDRSLHIIAVELNRIDHFFCRPVSVGRVENIITDTGRWLFELCYGLLVFCASAIWIVHRRCGHRRWELVYASQRTSHLSNSTAVGYINTHYHKRLSSIALKTIYSSDIALFKRNGRQSVVAVTL